MVYSIGLMLRMERDFLTYLTCLDLLCFLCPKLFPYLILFSLHLCLPLPHAHAN